MIFAIINKGVMEGFTKKMTSEQRSEEGEEISHVGICGESILGRWKRECKGSKQEDRAHRWRYW